MRAGALRLLFALALLQHPSPAAAAPQLATCGASGAALTATAVELQPPTVRAGDELEAEVTVEVLSADGLHRAEDLQVHVTATFCRRLSDCMEIYHHQEPFCELANLSASSCSDLAHGDKIVVKRSVLVPEGIFRGAYDVLLQVRDGEEVVACNTLSSVVVSTHDLLNHMNDVRDAVIAFGVAASSSKALGSLFPVLSFGVLPQISGFLLMGIVVGPYVTNLVTLLHIHILGRWINHLSLAFIAGAAGLEIFFPDLRDLIGPMLYQVLFVTVSTLTISSLGLLAISQSGLVTVSVLLSQPSVAAQAAVCAVAGSLMIARSPASAIAVISEMQCNHLSCSKIVLGVTVLSDIVVLILFALATSLARVVTLGGTMGIGTVVDVVSQIGVSLLLGVVASQGLRLMVRAEDRTSDVSADEEAVGLLQVGTDVRYPTFAKALRGASVIGVLFATYELAAQAEELTGGILRLEPILACTAAGCLAGHDESRRHLMEEAMSFWTSSVLLPFFTLAGASLQLPGLSAVLPAALALVILRMVGIAVGSVLAGLASQRRYPNLNISNQSVQYTWLTMLAQAGVTLGLVLEVQEAFSWGHQFGVLIIGVVVINQLIGPVMCRVGLGRIVDAESHTGLRGHGDGGMMKISSGISGVK